METAGTEDIFCKDRQYLYPFDTGWFFFSQTFFIATNELRWDVQLRTTIAHWHRAKAYSCSHEGCVLNVNLHSSDEVQIKECKYMAREGVTN
jgi:hypothetical protein